MAAFNSHRYLICKTFFRGNCSYDLRYTGAEVDHIALLQFHRGPAGYYFPDIKRSRSYLFKFHSLPLCPSGVIYSRSRLKVLFFRRDDGVVNHHSRYLHASWIELTLFSEPLHLNDHDAAVLLCSPGVAHRVHQHGLVFHRDVAPRVDARSPEDGDIDREFRIIKILFSVYLHQPCRIRLRHGIGSSALYPRVDESSESDLAYYPRLSRAHVSYELRKAAERIDIAVYLAFSYHPAKPRRPEHVTYPRAPDKAGMSEFVEPCPVYLETEAGKRCQLYIPGMARLFEALFNGLEYVVADHGVEKARRPYIRSVFYQFGSFSCFYQFHFCFPSCYSSSKNSTVVFSNGTPKSHPYLRYCPMM